MTSHDPSADALQGAWRALDGDPSLQRNKVIVADAIARHRGLIDRRRADDLHRLLIDPDLDPRPFAAAGWRHLAACGRLPTADAAGAALVESSAFLRDLLTETFVAVADAERALSALRRWLLLSGHAADFPKTTAAFVAQAIRNEGAWPFEPDERAAFEEHALRPAYLPPRPAPLADADASSTTARVAAQYEGWPYPTWERITRRRRSLRQLLDRIDADAATALPARPKILIAGCGTGSEALRYARMAPEARITAIDLSATSLRYAQERCAQADNIDFRQIDLHQVADLNASFDVIVSAGVLHHLPDPEAGWSALVGVLRPGGVMNVQLYSTAARLPLQAARRKLADLLARPVDDDLIREARARLNAAPYNPLAESPDFYSLAGAYDLIFHEHEDPFDIPRIRAAIEANGLELLRFVLPSPDEQTRYRAERPDDPHNRDFAGWQACERRDPSLFAAMYDFWCRKPA
ncbi:class I SAM-dependent methyltransferase [Sphingomonas sp.]|uniref:class I SAM-dependent methyltransferase n=1 Tax=Sphingomonas sp. TaxID=28214 RepID=UPI0025CF9FD2|nr:class I SAM-dependent methyltransferase [Sphingomonas sp.]